MYKCTSYFISYITPEKLTQEQNSYTYTIASTYFYFTKSEIHNSCQLDIVGLLKAPQKT